MYSRSFCIIFLAAGWLLLLVSTTAGVTITVDPTQGDTIADALLTAATGDEILLKPGIYVGPGNRNLEIGNEIDNLIIRSDSHPEYCIIDAETNAAILNAQGVDLTVSGIRFRRGNGETGSALFCSGGSLTVINCEFINNISSGNGGAVCLLNMQQTTFSNCLFAGNSGGTGGALFINFTDTTEISHSTFSGNIAYGSAAIHSQHSTRLSIRYSILWGNSEMAIINEAGELDVQYTDANQDVGGENNMNLNPLFATSTFGTHYLASEDAGYSEDSPCINAFSDLHTDDFPEMAARTTSVYHDLDTDLLDLGYHYTPDFNFATPTPTATPTVTPTPTATYTVTPSPTHGPNFQVDLILSDSELIEGDLFNLDIQFTNTMARSNPLRLYVVLDVYGQLFFAPEWTQENQFQYISLAKGMSGFTLLNFIWPQVNGSAEDLYFYAGVLDTHGQRLIADLRFPDKAIAMLPFSYSSY